MKSHGFKYFYHVSHSFNDIVNCFARFFVKFYINLRCCCVFHVVLFCVCLFSVRLVFL